MDDAKRMKTTEYKDGKKETISLADKYNWKQMPQIMMKWRAVAACARVVFADVVLGLYTPDEMGATVDVETGEILSEPAQIHSLPTKTQLAERSRVETAKPVAAPPVPANSILPAAAPAALSTEQQHWREEIKSLMESMQMNPAAVLARFDANPDKRESGLREVRKAAIKHVISSDQWGLTEDGTTEFLLNQGIVAIDDATDEALTRCIYQMQELGNLR